MACSGKSVVVEMVASNARRLDIERPSGCSHFLESVALATADNEIIRQNSWVDISPPIDGGCEPIFSEKVCIWQGTRKRVVSVSVVEELRNCRYRVLYEVDLVKYRYEAEPVPINQSL